MTAIRLAGPGPASGPLFGSGAARRSGWGVGPSLALALGGPSALSYLMEVLQHFVPNRHPSLPLNRHRRLAIG